MNSFEITVGAAFVLLTIAAWMVSTRRNKGIIDDFGYEDVDQLKICLLERQIRPVEKKLGKIGWQLIRTERLLDGQVHAWFGQTSDEASLPLKEVLHSLNRAGYLSAGPVALEKEEEQLRS